MDLTEPYIINLPKVADPRGNLSFIQCPDQVPFPIARCYWIYDVPSGRERDGHAYYTSSELIVALSGNFVVETIAPDGTISTFRLTNPRQALLVPPLHWRTLYDFATNSVAMVLASSLYSPDDYIFDKTILKQINEQ